MTLKLTVLIPAYNEESTIISLLIKVLQVEIEGVEKEIVVIDDCSKDGTKQLVEDFISKYPENNITLIQTEGNSGKGAAIHKGIEIAGGDFVIVQDADLEYDPGEYKLLLQPVLEEKADVVYGSRFMGDNPHRVLFFWHYVGNKFLTTLSNMFTNINLTDMETCYKLFRTSYLKKLKLKEKGFGFEPEVTAKISRIPGVRIYEVGISYYGRTYEEGKKIRWTDGVKAIFYILKYNLFPGKILN